MYLRLRRRQRLLAHGAVRWHFKILRDSREVALRETRSALHERLVHWPETPRNLIRVLRQFRGFGRIGAPGKGQVSKNVPHSLAKAAPQALDDLMNGMTPGTCIAAVLQQGHFGVRRAENMIVARVYGRIKHVRSRTGNDGRILLSRGRSYSYTTTEKTLVNTLSSRRRRVGEGDDQADDFQAQNALSEAIKVCVANIRTAKNVMRSIKADTEPTARDLWRHSAPESPSESCRPR
jgi:hypothetical protein